MPVIGRSLGMERPTAQVMVSWLYYDMVGRCFSRGGVESVRILGSLPGIDMLDIVCGDLAWWSEIRSKV